MMTEERNRLSERAHRLIPGGAHTYAKGDDQYPSNAPRFMVRGSGCRVWDDEGHQFIEYGMGLRSVTLGHGFAPVVNAVAEAVAGGINFVRPHVLEADAAERLLEFLGLGDDMQVKFAKNGSDVTTAAVRLARAATGRDLVAVCSSQPFFSTDDWFIGATAMSSGIPRVVRDLTIAFPFGDIAALTAVIDAHDGQIAALIMEAEAGGPPPEGYFAAVRDLCTQHGIVFILDEIVTGFRWHNRGARFMHNIDADLVTYAKALGNGVPVGALVGRRSLMELGGLHTDRERVFLLSTTYGGDTMGLAAAMAVMDTYEAEPVVDHLWAYGARVREGVAAIVAEHGIEAHLGTAGRDCCQVFWTKDTQGEPSQYFRALFMQELVKGGVIGPSFVDSYAHDDVALETTLRAVDAASFVYAKALDAGSTEGLLIGPPTKPVFRPYV